MKKLILKLTLYVPDDVVKTTREGMDCYSPEIIADYVLETKNGAKLVGVEKI